MLRNMIFEAENPISAFNAQSSGLIKWCSKCLCHVKSSINKTLRASASCCSPRLYYSTTFSVAVHAQIQTECGGDEGQGSGSFPLENHRWL